jgi:ABC-type polar amino acid transport system ATPase subunit
MLSFENLSKKFGSKKVIDDVSFSVPKGSIAVLLGPSGVGKSTLLRVLNNLETIDEGSITLDGKPLDLKAVPKKHTCGMVFQQFNLFDHLTVLENITLALEKVEGKSKQEARKIAIDLLHRYDLGDKKDAYPSQLSGGQKQRLALARSIALRPKIMCFDEPTSALDPMLTTHVANTIQELADEGYIVLIASHDTALLDKLRCSIYLMDNGKIIETATSEELSKNPTLFPRIKRFIEGAVNE